MCFNIEYSCHTITNIIHGRRLYKVGKYNRTLILIIINENNDVPYGRTSFMT